MSWLLIKNGYHIVPSPSTALIQRFFFFCYRIMWTLSWKFFTPVILSIITVYAWVNHEPMGYDDYEFPASIEAVGWIMEMLPLVIVLLYPIIPLYKVEWANKELFCCFYRAQLMFSRKKPNSYFH